MAWIYLIIAGLLEIVWAVGLKQSENFSKLVPTVITIVGVLLSFWLLSIALKTLPVGTGYAVWTGIGALGTVIFGILILGEQASLPKIVFTALLVISLIGLRLTSPE